jgi:hypothetical protein
MLAHRAADLDMGIAPRRQARVRAEIFDADVVAADERAVAVDDDDLAMVAEVQLEAVDELAAGRERMHVDAAAAQRVDVAARQIEAADAVVQQIAARRLRRARAVHR